VTIYCLVRCADEETPQARLLAALRTRAALPDPLQELIRVGRVRAIKGDLTAPALGLSEEDVVRVTEHLRTVVHCGAWVNHTVGYRTLRSSNADSAAELTRIMSRVAVPPACVYISTISVLADGDDETCYGSAASIEGRGGYAQSKWVAEMRLREAHRRGITGRLSIVRSGLISWHSLTGTALALN
jgi:thioester reductase-like protein